MKQTYVALDLEFTGLDLNQDEIIEIAMVKFRGNEVLETFSSLVQSRREIPFKIQQLVGITQVEVHRAPTLRSLMGEIIAFVRNHPLVAHTIETDLTFLRRQGIHLNNLPIDTFELASIVMPEAHVYSLASLSEMLGITLEQNHRALPDAMATMDLFLALLDRLHAVELEVLEEVVTAAEGTEWPLRLVFRNALLERQSEDLLAQRALSSRRSLPPIEFDEAPPLEPKQHPMSIDIDTLAEAVSPGGAFAARFPGYEHRPQQVDMLRAVADAFNTPMHLVVEAGTGVGKSIAYLLPAIAYAVQNTCRVVISSNTINLQDQLIQKDIPDIRRVLPTDFCVAVLKGRNNYLCQQRLHAFRRGRRLSADEVRLLAKVLFWLPTTLTGDRAELLLIGLEGALWSEIASDALTCLGDLCPYRQSGMCLFYNARSKANRAHLVIVNHALLLSDLALDNRILPDYQHLIIDEAHHLEESATGQFGFEVASRDVYAFLASLSHQGAETAAGVLAAIPGLFQTPGIGAAIQEASADTIQTIRARVDEAGPLLRELFSILLAFLTQQGGTQRSSQDSYDQRIRLTSSLRTQPDWSLVEIAWDNLAMTLRQVIRDLQRLQGLFENLPSREDSERNELAQELAATIQRGDEIVDGLHRILAEPEEGGIYWVEMVRRTEELTLHSAPLSVGPLLQERLFSQKASVVLTSATLAAGNSFRYIEQRLGLEDPQELALGSPFDFESAVLLYVPKDMPEPYQPYYQRSVEQALIDLCIATEGRTMVLFTSNSQLNNTYRAIEGPLAREDILVLAQGMDGSRRQLLQSFRSAPRAVLLGTRSFWEGVDVAGQALSCLVITRLPFAVPTDPIFAARSATFDDPFHEYSLPDAILRFRQGFGRLIRSKDDYGVIVVLDKRILTKAYGKKILQSLPPCTARQGPLQALPDVARRWLNPQNRR